MKALIDIYGPPYLKAVKALEAIAIDSPEVCIMNQLLLHTDPYTYAADWVFNYFKGRGKVSKERCGKILTKSSNLEGHDFVFEWFVEPTMENINNLISKIDETLAPLGVRYTLKLKK